MGLGENETRRLLGSFLEIDPLDTDSFLKVKETLTRIGLPGKRVDGKPTLWQTAHVLHKRGRYFICHFKQLFLLDGKHAEITSEDEDRLYFIVSLLEEWNLVRCLFEIDKPKVTVLVIPYSERHSWNLKQKYQLGKRSDRHGKE